MFWSLFSAEAFLSLIENAATWVNRIDFLYPLFFKSAMSWHCFREIQVSGWMYFGFGICEFLGIAVVILLFSM